MNIHHVELFYYVARHGGISAAVRHIPYGIQQPAVSSQVAQLERDLGTRLFERKPFRLTKAGTELYDFARPFFEELDTMAQRLKFLATPTLRVGAAEFVLRDYLPPVVTKLKERHPDLQLGLRGGFTPDIEQWLLAGEIDVAITPWEGRPASGLNHQLLVRRPLALMVRKKDGPKSAKELWARESIPTPLIRLPVRETITRLFLKGLEKKSVDWSLAIEASSLDLIAQYVAAGHGIGLGVNVPESVRNPDVALLPLDDFEEVEIVALWRGEATPLLQDLLAEADTVVARRWPRWKCK